MDVSSVKNAPTQPKPAPKRAEQVERTPQQSAQNKASEVKNAPPPPKPSPVINTQGHTTGRLLNTTA